MDPDLAISTLVENGLMVGEQRDMSDDDPAMEGKVCYASYTAGALVEPGTTIDIGISTGPASTTYMYQDAIQKPGGGGSQLRIPGRIRVPDHHHRPVRDGISEHYGAHFPLYLREYSRHPQRGSGGADHLHL